jgi:hypothetical protein
VRQAVCSGLPMWMHCLPMRMAGLNKFAADIGPPARSAPTIVNRWRQV